MAAKKKLNKTAFIRQHSNLTAKDLVKKAKDSGIKLSEKYVYNIRAKIKAQGGKKPGRPGRPPGKVNGSKRVAAGSSEGAFVDLVLDIGVGRAEQLLKDIRSAAASAAN